MKLIRALIIPAEGMPTTTLVASPAGDFINATVGGWFDCVRSDRFHGYVNDTAIRRANGKQWPKYRESDRCQSYLDALFETSGIRMFDLIESRQVKSYCHSWLAVTLKRYRAQVAGG